MSSFEREPGCGLAENVDQVIEAAFADQRLVGAVVLVAHRGQWLYRRAAGLADREAGRIMGEDSLFRLASVSKPIVSVAALSLVDEGRLALDEPIADWLPAFRPRLADGREARITPRQLLSHSAGLGYRFLEADADGPYARAGISDGMDLPGFDLAENLRRLASVPLLYEPGLAWGLLAGYARRLVPPEQQGRALAVAMLGAPLALSLGVPLGTWLGGLLGWRWAFGLLSLTALLLVGWVLRSVPDFPGQPAGRRLRLLGVLRTPGVRPVLLVIVAWVLAHNILYTYIAPFLAKVGLGASVDLALLVFGSAAVAGIWLVGVLVDRHLRRMVLASLALFAVAALALCLGARWSWLAFAGLALWGLTFGGAATLLQTASADAAGEGADLAQSMIVVAWNLAIAGGGALGGMVLQRWGSEMLPWTLLPLIGLAAVLVWGNAAHAFRVGPRDFRRASSEHRKAAQ
ncbi:TPA: MFS transporter [Pseudomonas aeruginosa]